MNPSNELRRDLGTGARRDRAGRVSVLLTLGGRDEVYTPALTCAWPPVSGRITRARNFGPSARTPRPPRPRDIHVRPPRRTPHSCGSWSSSRLNPRRRTSRLPRRTRRLPGLSSSSRHPRKQGPRSGPARFVEVLSPWFPPVRRSPSPPARLDDLRLEPARAPTQCPSTRLSHGVRRAD
jgi:hypothetical protein